jgi:hypothetical protein
MKELEIAAQEELMHSYSSSTVIISTYGESARIEKCESFFFSQEAMINMFRKGAEWQAKQSPWISVEDKLPSLNQKVIVYNGKQVYISHRTEKDYAKDTNSFLYGLQTYNVVAWMPIPSFDEILEANKDVLDWEFEIDDFQDE